MADYERVLALWGEAGAGVPLRPSDGREQIALKLTRDPDLFLVAVHGDRLVGSVIGGWDGRRAYIYHLAVDAGVRRRGVGTALLTELEERMRSKGALKVKCQVYTDNEASIEFFGRCGYEVEAGLHALGKELVAGGAPPVAGLGRLDQT